MIAGAQTRNRTVPTFIWNTTPSGCFSKPATGFGAVHWACTDAAKRNATNAKREIRALRWRVMTSNLAVILDHAQAATKGLRRTAAGGAAKQPKRGGLRLCVTATLWLPRPVAH